MTGEQKKVFESVSKKKCSCTGKKAFKFECWPCRSKKALQKKELNVEVLYKWVIWQYGEGDNRSS